MNKTKSNQIHTSEESKNVRLKTTELSFFRKLLQMYWVNPKSWILDEFILQDGILTAKTRNGKIIQGSLSEISTKYSVDNYDRHEFYLKDMKGNKLHFKQIPDMLSDEEWELIISILSPEKHILHKVVSSVKVAKETAKEIGGVIEKIGEVTEKVEEIIDDDDDDELE